MKLAPAGVTALGLGLAVGALALAGCRDRRGAGDRPATEPVASAGGCAAIEYAPTIDLPEASGASWLADPGVLLVVSDSGNDGQYVELDAGGAIVRRGQLPLGGAGDDLEGLAQDGGKVWGLTSSGWMRAWQRDGAAWRLALDAYPIDPARPCGAESVNCGANFEGLCLAARPLADGCDGYAASKTSGQMTCLRRQGDRFVLDPSRGFTASDPRVLADCAIADDGTVWTGDNAFGLMQVRQWTIGAAGATVTGAARLGLGFPEVLALGPGGVVYRFSDLGGAPSLTTAFRCTGLPKAGPDAPAQ